MTAAVKIDEDDKAGAARDDDAREPPKMSRADAAEGLILDDEGLRHRRCLVTGEVQAEICLMRFVVDPDGHVVPDAGARLPGRGMWVSATRDAVGKAVEKKLFSRAAKQQVTATADLADRAEKALLVRINGDLGLARRSGALTLGFDNVLRALEGPKPPKVLIEAFDGSPDGKRKLYAAAHRLELACVVIECLTSAELGLALGRENVIHAAVLPGGLAERLTLDAARLAGFRPAGARARNESPRPQASGNESPRADASRNESKP